jgi:hypothetical protein
MKSRVGADAGAALLGAIIGIGCALWRMAQPGLIDFQTFWFIAHGHLQQAYDLFLMARPEAAAWTHNAVAMPFPYPPTALFLMRCFALAPWRYAFCAWSGLQLGAFAFVAHRMLGRYALLAVLGLPALYSAAVGQTGLWTADLVLGAFLVLDARPRVAGALLALAGCVKPQSVLCLPFSFWRRPAILLASAAVGAAIFVSSFALWPGLWREWTQAAPAFLRTLVLGSPVAPSMLFSAPGWKIALAIVGFSFAAWDRSLAGFVVGTLLASPYFQLYDVAPACVLGLTYFRRWRVSGRWRDAPLGAIGVFVALCPMPAWTLLAFCAAVIICRMAERDVQPVKVSAELDREPSPPPRPAAKRWRGSWAGAPDGPPG